MPSAVSQRFMSALPIAASGQLSVPMTNDALAGIGVDQWNSLTFVQKVAWLIDHAVNRDSIADAITNGLVGGYGEIARAGSLAEQDFNRRVAPSGQAYRPDGLVSRLIPGSGFGADHNDPAPWPPRPQDGAALVTWAGCDTGLLNLASICTSAPMCDGWRRMSPADKRDHVRRWWNQLGATRATGMDIAHPGWEQAYIAQADAYCRQQASQYASNNSYPQGAGVDFTGAPDFWFNWYRWHVGNTTVGSHARPEVAAQMWLHQMTAAGRVELVQSLLTSIPGHGNRILLMDPKMEAYNNDSRWAWAAFDSMTRRYRSEHGAAQHIAQLITDWAFRVERNQVAPRSVPAPSGASMIERPSRLHIPSPTTPHGVLYASRGIAASGQTDTSIVPSTSTPTQTGASIGSAIGAEDGSAPAASNPTTTITQVPGNATPAPGSRGVRPAVFIGVTAGTIIGVYLYRRARQGT